MERYHFIGIGGIGMSGLARILLSRKVTVTGSDLASSYVTEGLKEAGAKVFLGQASNNISSDMTVVYSTDIKKSNPEYQEAIRLHCPMLHRSDLLLRLMDGYKTIAIAGTHGKTTTSALMTTVLKAAEMDPAFAVGGILQQFHSNAGHGDGEYFVAEADESDGTFLKYHPHGAIITNIDRDHMDHFGSEQALCEAFNQFARQVQSPVLLWCGDDARLQKLGLPGSSYGFGKNCHLRAFNVIQKGWSLRFDIEFRGVRYSQVEVSLIGQHNVLNAAAVFGLALLLGVSEEKIRIGLKSFGGVKRRCEKKGEANQVLVLDDYAHHPTEVRTTLNGIRSAIGKRRLIAVFQPHRYSRTKDCLGSFGDIFQTADKLFITDIFSAGESPIPGITTDKVVEEVKPLSQSCQYVPRNDLLDTLVGFLRPHDVLVTLGAGDVTRLGAELVQRLAVKTHAKG